MRPILLPLAALAIVAGASAAVAQAAAAPKAGTVLLSADGKRLGRIDRVVAGSDGQPLAVTLIYSSRFVKVPASTLSTDDKGHATTSLTRAEVGALR